MKSRPRLPKNRGKVEVELIPVWNPHAVQALADLFMPKSRLEAWEARFGVELNKPS